MITQAQIDEGKATLAKWKERLLTATKGSPEWMEAVTMVSLLTLDEKIEELEKARGALARLYG